MRRILLTLLFISGVVPLFGQEPEKEPKKKDSTKSKGYPDRLLYAPTPVPDRVILTWSGNTSTTQSVTWRTDTTVTEAVGQITEATPGPSFDPSWGKNARAADVVRSVNAVTELLKTDLHDCHCHSVTFRGLKPKTKYVYRVGFAPNWSEWFQFETASEQPEPFGFIYVGDAQDDVKRHWSRLIRQAISDMPKAKFFMHAGDLISRGNSDGQWGEWFGATGWVNGTIPSIPTPGNHEYGAAPRTPEQIREDSLEGAVGGGLIVKKTPRPTIVTNHWRAQFTLPTHGPVGLEETCYYLDIQGVRIICLNSMEKVEAQVPWLENALKNNPNRWTIVTFHVPLYSLTKARQDVDEKKTIRKFWRPILERYHVDLVLQGHDHCYGRSGLMRDDNPLNELQDEITGSVYVVSVSGPKMYDVNVKPWMMSSAQMKQFYQLIRIDGDTLHFQARTADGELYDEFQLKKGSDGPSQLVEHAAIESGAGKSSVSRGREAILAIVCMGVLAGGYAGWRALRRNHKTDLAPSPKV